MSEVTNSIKKNILIVHNYYQIAGGEDVVVANEKAMLENHGHNVTLHTRDNSELKEMGKLSMGKLFFSTIYNKRTYKDIVSIIREKNIDIVHVHNTLNLISPAVYYAAETCGVPVVQTIHNYRLICPGATMYRDGHICDDCVRCGLGQALKHKCYRGSLTQTLTCVLMLKINRLRGIYKRINYICLTEFGKNVLLKQDGVFDKDRIFVKPNFVKAQTDNLKVIPNEDRENQIVFAGRLDKTKGIDLLLEAWRRIYAEKEDGNRDSFKDSCKLIICGTGPMEEWCKDFITREKLDNVVMMGKVTHDEVIEIMASSKAMILPTRWYEGFPMSVVESFSVGTLVIGPDMGNVGAIIQDGVTGYKYQDGNIDGMIAIIKRVFGEADDMSETIYQEYLDKYTEEKNYELLCGIYETVSAR